MFETCFGGTGLSCSSALVGSVQWLLIRLAQEARSGLKRHEANMLLSSTLLLLVVVAVVVVVVIVVVVVVAVVAVAVAVVVVEVACFRRSNLAGAERGTDRRAW